MTKSKVLSGVVTERNGAVLVLSNGDHVVPNAMKHSGQGDTVRYVEMRSLQTVRMQAGATQWKESKATGHRFYKEV